MNKFKNVLVILKTSKLKYLIDKFGLDTCKASEEYEMLHQSMETHTKSCDFFLNELGKFKRMNVDLHYDNFVTNPRFKRNYDLIFSLGGDGTFLRSSQYSGESAIVGVNTDKDNSVGYYCYVNASGSQNYLTKLFNNEYNVELLSKLEAHVDGSIHYALNDLYFGEHFLGRVSKYRLKVSEKETCREEVIKSSGIIFSTYHGYSGWIRNANTISFQKFCNLIGRSISLEDSLKLYNSKIYNSKYDEGSIFYFVREPQIRKSRDLERHHIYLNFMEGTADKISLHNFGFDGILILDGSYTVPVKYNSEIQIRKSDETVKTIKIV